MSSFIVYLNSTAPISTLVPNSVLWAIDAFTSRLRDVTNIAGFWSKRSSENHCSQWEPYGILLLFLNVLLKSLLLFHDQLVLISLHYI